MSYDLGIFSPAVRKRVEEGAELDAFEHPPLDSAAVERFIALLGRYAYQPEPAGPNCRGFKKKVAGFTIRVRVYSTEIAFSVPYGPDAEGAIFEALQDASEIVESKHLALFNPQTGEWADV